MEPDFISMLSELNRTFSVPHGQHIIMRVVPEVHLGVVIIGVVISDCVIVAPVAAKPVWQAWDGEESERPLCCWSSDGNLGNCGKSDGKAMLLITPLAIDASDVAG